MAKTTTKPSNGANLGFEQTLWKAADKLRGSMDPSEYKHVVLGLMFLKYISDGFEEQYQKLVAQKSSGADPEDRDEYRAENVFWVPQNARWTFLQNNAKQPTIGRLIDDAMDAIEKENPSLKGVLPKDFARPSLDKTRLGELIDILASVGLGTKENRSQDTLGRVYEYFLGQFASAEGKKGGEFYTPRSVVRILVEMLAPYKGRVYDPCCGTGGMFVQSEEFILAHGESKDALSIYGQESNNTTWRLAKMNLAIRGISNNLGSENADSFHRDLHPDLKADYILANPPFNMSDWGGDRLREDKRWVYGTPPVGNANYAWIQHFIHHLAPGGTAGFVMSNGSLSSNTSGEGEIRKAIIEADLVDCIVALPTQLFYTTTIPVTLWFLSRGKNNHSGKTLFIDARRMGLLIDRRHRDFSENDIQRITSTYHSWSCITNQVEVNQNLPDLPYEDIPGFCISATIDKIRNQGYILTPGRYVGSTELEADNELFDLKLAHLINKLENQFKEGQDIENRIRENLSRLG
ncbi:MAG: N-6 DNA methylase [Chloroflexi bacterium HGW-Chloroflexi-5]|jgi:type I restriction enzyme M protein|nr:MAG: N-6 DNA methylase [Chloroflexi bacterium HGW-Chloroflexi-5]